MKRTLIYSLALALVATLATTGCKHLAVTAEGRDFPFFGIRYRDRIDMRIQQDSFSAASDPSKHIAHGIELDFIKSKREHFFPDELDDGAFLSRDALDPDQALRKFKQLFSHL